MKFRSFAALAIAALVTGLAFQMTPAQSADNPAPGMSASITSR